MMGDRSESLLELLIRVNRDVAGALELGTVLQRLIMAATQHVGGERASIIVVDEAGRPVDATILYGTKLHHHTTRQLRETVERGLAGWVIRHGEPVLIADTSLDKRWVRRPDDEVGQTGAKSAICVPLSARGQTVGALTLVHPKPHSFDNHHLELAHAIADQASIAVLNARLYADSSRQARIMTALVESAASFGSSLALDETFDRVLNQTMQSLQVESAALGMLDGTDGALVIRAATGKGAANLVGQTISRTEHEVAEVLSKGRAIEVIEPNVGKEAEFPSFQGLELRAMMLAPVEARGRPTGVLFAFNPAAGKFETDAGAVLRGIGALAGATIQNSQLYDRLHWAQRRYLEMFEESFDLVFVTDLDGQITEANRQAARVTGLSQERLCTMSIRQLHDVDWDQVGKDFTQLQRRGSVRYESALQKAEGGAVPVEVRASPIDFPAAGFVLWTMHDLTERRALDELRENLISMIYHDLRSPLGNLASSLELLRTMLPDPAGLDTTLQIAERSVHRMRRMVDSLLDINRLEAGHRLTSQTSIDPAALVGEAVRAVAPHADGLQPAISTSIPEGLPPIWADGDMLERVLVNLLENAMKFSRGSKAVQIGVRLDESMIEFWVQDQGPGIPGDQQARIFEKFTRFSSDRAGTPGLGLGLAFCKLAVKAHEGTIHVESREGAGARFVVRLPLKAPMV